VGAVRSLELIVHTCEEANLCIVLREVDGIAGTVGEVPQHCGLEIELPCLLLTEVPREGQTSLGGELIVVAVVVNYYEVIVTEDEGITETHFRTYFEGTVGTVFAEEIGEVDGSVKTQVQALNDCLGVCIVVITKRSQTFDVGTKYRAEVLTEFDTGSSVQGECVVKLEVCGCSTLNTEVEVVEELSLLISYLSLRTKSSKEHSGYE